MQLTVSGRFLGAAAAVGALALIAIITDVVLRNGEADTDNTVDRLPIQPPASGPVPELAPVETATTAEVATVEYSTVNELQIICNTPWNVIDDQCAVALDARYMDETVALGHLFDHAGSYWLHSQERLPAASELVTWRDAFANPAEARRAVEGALSRPACHVPEGETRHDLGRQCAADAFAKLAVIHQACVMPLVLYSSFNPWRPGGEEPTWSGPSAAEIDETWARHIGRLDEDASLTVEAYWSRRTEIEDARLRFAWRLMRCRGVEGELAWLDDLPQPTGDNENQSQARPLAELAARLGNEWAQLELEQARHIRNENWSRNTGLPASARAAFTELTNAQPKKPLPEGTIRISSPEG